MDGQTDPNYRKSSLLTILTEFFQNKDSVLLGETLADMVQSNEKLKKGKIKTKKVAQCEVIKMIDSISF